MRTCLFVLLLSLPLPLAAGCDEGGSPPAAVADASVPAELPPLFGEGECSGVVPSAAEVAEGPSLASEETPQSPTELGAATPPWRLEDFQPDSCGSGQHYGLDAFGGDVILVAMLASW